MLCAQSPARPALPDQAPRGKLAHGVPGEVYAAAVAIWGASPTFGRRTESIQPYRCLSAKTPPRDPRVEQADTVTNRSPSVCSPLQDSQ